MVDVVYIGVDGGGTSTSLVAISIEKKQPVVLATAEVASTNKNAVGEQKAKINLISGLEKILSSLAKLNIPNSRIKRICVSLAGVSCDADKILVVTWIRPVLPRHVAVIVENDVVAALASGTGGVMHGVVCIAGTGMNVFAIDSASGKQVFVGGMGPFLGDRGGGYAVGDAILSACARANDGRGAPTALLPAVLSKLNRSQFLDLIPWRYDPNCKLAEVSALAPLAFELAEQGDEVALNIVKAEAEELVLAICTAIRMIESFQRKPVDVVLAGSLWKAKLCHDLVRDGILAHFPDANVFRPPIDPDLGAALVAAKPQKAISEVRLDSGALSAIEDNNVSSLWLSAAVGAISIAILCVLALRVSATR
jgi:N-acetylglucosamine kinase-like BadF-type ATPase